MKKTLLLTCLLCASLLLSACAGTASASGFGNGDGGGNGFGGGSRQTGLPGIFSIFSGGRRTFTLTAQEKLAIGTIKLDANGQSIDRAEAAKLLPLWQLLHQLYSSSSATPQEEAAVVDQIRSTMTPSQVAAIDGMQLSRSDMFASLQQGQASTAATSGTTGGTSGSRGSTGGNGARGNGGGQGFFFSGGPGGGFGGGGFGGGGFRNGTGTGNGTTGGTTTAQQNITAAQRAAAATSGITNALINQVISLLQDKLAS